MIALYNDNDMNVHELHEHNGTMVNPQFRFSNAQYEQFEIATIVCSSISIVSAAMVVGMYIYLCIHNPKDANRVSLHCVIASTIFSFLSQATNLAALRTDVESSYCTSFRVLNLLFPLGATSFLSMVGIYLVLVFCFNVRHWPCRPEYILFSASIIYTIVGNLLGFIHNSVPPGFHTIFLSTKDECWYYSNFIDRIYTKDAWIYYYVFLFFITTVSFVCSLAVMRRVHIDKAANQKKLIQIATRGSDQSFLRTPTPKDPTPAKKETMVGRQISSVHKLISRRTKSNPDSFSKVIFRTLLYPITPLLVHIFGFALQMYLINDSHLANYGVVMVTIVMTRLEGTLIACIFFVDPSVIKIIQGFWLKLKSLVCAHETSLPVERPSVVVTLPSNSPSPLPTLTPISSMLLDPESPIL